MSEKGFPSKPAGVLVNGQAAGQSTASGIPQSVTSEMHNMTLAAETTLAVARNLEELGQSLETLGCILQALEQHL
jgi:hypothetical protein